MSRVRILATGVTLGVVWLTCVAGWAADKTAPPVKPGKSAAPATSSAPPTWLDMQDKTGATPESEHAVELALKWLAAHQINDGSWTFGQGSEPGDLTIAVNGATGMAILPFIAHGNTHLTGPYTANVVAGLRFLIGRMGADGRLWEPGGRMYSHALGTLALCEDQRVIDEGPNPRAMPMPNPSGSAYSPATPDSPANPSAKPPAASPAPKPALPSLREKQIQRYYFTAAARAVAYSGKVQDPLHGGWRYDASPDSDISVTGWQTMAMYSASKVHVPMPRAWDDGVRRFLDSVQQDNGAAYGYHPTGMQVTPGRRAIGLLCRIDTGWNRSRQALLDGAAAIAKAGPSEGDMYYDYYATNVLHELGGPDWLQWNAKMQPFLIRTQAQQGDETGSWSFHGGEGSKPGGRLLNTALACLILESYYRSEPKLPPPPKYDSSAQSLNKPSPNK